MNKAGGIIAMVAGVFSVIAAIVTLLVGGLGSAFKADSADTVVALGWGGVVFSFLVIVFGAVALFRPKGAGIGLIVCSIAGAVLGGTIVAVFMVLSLIGGVVCLVGSRQRKDSGIIEPGTQLEANQSAATCSHLERLADLRSHGVLSEGEFQAEKAKVLGSVALDRRLSVLPPSIDGTATPGIQAPTRYAISPTSQQPQIAPHAHTVPVGAFCGTCGTKVVPEGKFCGICGAGVTQPAPTIIQLTAVPHQQSRVRTRRWVFAGVGMLCALVIGVVFVSSTKSEASGKSYAEASDPLTTVANAEPANIAPDGEIAKIFTLGSDYTELQRENTLNELRDKIVAWNLPVYEVKREGDGYKVQTSNHRVVGTFVYLTARNDEERRFIERLKTGDTIPFKGRIAGSSLRNLVIKTAILDNGLYITSRTNQGTNETATIPLGVTPDVQVYIAPDAENVVKAAGLAEQTIKDAVRQGLAKRRIVSIADNAVVEGLDDWVSVHFSIDPKEGGSQLDIEFSVRNGASANNQLIRWQETNTVETLSPTDIPTTLTRLMDNLQGDFNSPQYKTGRMNDPTR